jgi:murein DD-endopeptidase MepM/ murein hydrolase activator NlpD
MISSISSLIEKLNIRKLGTTTLLVVFIILGFFGNSILHSRGAGKLDGYTLGGPASFSFSSDTNRSVTADGASEFYQVVNQKDESGYGAMAGAALTLPNPSSVSLEARPGVIVHKVQPGENLSVVAAQYGISLATLRSANGSPTVLHPGDQLTIPPVSGVIHAIQGDESIDAIAALYGVSTEDILAANENFSGGSVIVPGATEERSFARSNASLPNYDAYYLVPTPNALNWGILHRNNAVDFAKSCGTDVFASAEGLVVKAVRSGWNQGYGHEVVIEHPNNTKTLYAHLDQVLVSAGDFLAQGDVIGTIGNSGFVTGERSGCHVHFEVEGAKNPFARG